jgi:hypothetical protein
MALLIAQRTEPCPGYTVNGDGIVARRREHDWLLAVVDGVGHGSRAAEASGKILDYLQDDATSTDLAELLHGCDRRAEGTRGAAIGLISMVHNSSQLAYLGVGNVSTSLWTPDQKSETLINHNGIVGRLRRIFDPLLYETSDYQLLLMHSDGISSRAAYETMREWDGSLEAQADRILARSRQRDDVSLLLAQIRHDVGATRSTDS